MSYIITQKYISKNRSYRAFKPIGMTLHSTADEGATDENEQKYFDNNYVKASPHAFIDWDSITETVPDNELGYHAGYTANSKFLGVELCEPATYNPQQFQEVWNRGVWYFAYKFVNVLHINTVTKENLMSHAEVSDKWHETDHSDPVAYFKKYGRTVDQFRAEVQQLINEMLQISVQSKPQAQPKINPKVLAYQIAFNKMGLGHILEDGIWGNETLNSVSKLPLLKVGSRNAMVGWLQGVLGCQQDCIFGQITKAKLMSYQTTNKLIVDGIAGQQSIKFILVS